VLAKNAAETNYNNDENLVISRMTEWRIITNEKYLQNISGCCQTGSFELREPERSM